METVNLSELIKSGPKKTIAPTPLKKQEVFIPSKLSEAPKKSNILSDILRQGVVNTILKSEPVKLATDIGTQVVKEKQPKLFNIVKKESKPVLNVLEKAKQSKERIGESLVKPAVGLAYLEEGKQAREILKERENTGMDVSNIDKALTYFPILNKAIVDAHNDANTGTERNLLLYTGRNSMDAGLRSIGALTPSGYIFSGGTQVGEELGLGTKTFIEKGDKAVLGYLQTKLEKAGLNKSDAEDASNIIWDGINVGAGVLGSKYKKPGIKGVVTESVIQNVPQITAGVYATMLSEDKEKADKFKNAVDLLSGATSSSLLGLGITPSLKGKDKKTSTQDIIPDSEKIQKTDAQIDKEVSEKKSPTITTGKISKEDIKLYEQYGKEGKPGESFLDFKAKKEILIPQEKVVKQEEVKPIVEQPKAEENNLTKIIQDKLKEDSKIEVKKQEDNIDLIKIIQDKLKEEPKIETKKELLNSEDVSKKLDNSFLNNPSDKFLKSDRFNGDGLSYKEANTGFTSKGTERKIRISKRENSNNLYIDDGRHLLEAYRDLKKDIPENKFEFSSKEAEDIFKGNIKEQKLIIDENKKEAPLVTEIKKQSKVKETKKPKVESKRLKESELFPEEVIVKEEVIPEEQKTIIQREKITPEKAALIKDMVTGIIEDKRSKRVNQESKNSVIKNKIIERKDLQQENRMNEIIDSSDTFSEKELIDNVYNDNILTDDNKLALIDVIETKKTFQEQPTEGEQPFGPVDIEDTKTKEILGNTNNIVRNSRLYGDVEFTLTKDLADDIKYNNTTNPLVNDILNTYQGKNLKEGDIINIKNTEEVKKYLKKNKIENKSQSFEFDLTPGAEKNLSRAVNLDTFLNNIRIKMGDKIYSQFNNFTQGLKSLGKQVANQIFTDSKIKYILSDENISKSKKEINDTFNNISKDLDSTLIGGKTVNEQIEITNDNLGYVKENFKQGGKGDYKETFGEVNNDLLNKLGQIHFWKKINEGNQKLIDKYIPKDIQETLQKLEDLSRSVYDVSGPQLVKDGVLKGTDLENQYTRFVLYPEMRKKFEKEFLGGKSIFTTSDGMIFDSFLEMETYIKNQDRLGRVITPEFDSDKLSSLTKSKGTGDIDLFRYNSPTIQILDYMRQVGELHKQKSVFELFKKLDASKNPEIVKYRDTLLQSKFGFYENSIEQILNIGKKTSLLTTAIRKTGGVGNKLALILSIRNLAQAVTYGTARNVITGGNINMFRRLNKESKNILTKYGITQPFEASSFKEFADKTTSFFSGTPTENINKVGASIPIIKNFLKSKGYDIKKMNNDTLFKKFDNEMVNGDIKTRLEVTEDIYNATNYIGNTISQARNSVTLLNNLGFTGLKTFQTDRIGQLIQNTRNTIFGGTRQGRLKTGWKIAGPLLVKYGTVAAITAYILNRNEGVDDDEKISKEQAIETAKTISTQAFGDDLFNLKQAIFGIISNSGNIPVNVLKDMVESLGLIVKYGDKEQGSKLALANTLNILLTKTAAGKTVNLLTKATTGKELKESISDILKTPKFTGENTKGISTGMGIDSRIEAAAEILGYGWDTSTRNYIFEQINKAKVNIENPEMSDIGKLSLRYLTDFTNQISRDFSGLWLNPQSYGGLGGKVDSIIDKQYTVNVLNKLEGSNNINDLLLKLGINKDLKNTITQSGNKNIDTIRKVNNEMELLINERFLAEDISPIGTTFNERLKLLEQKNPVAFNNFISGLARTSRLLNEKPDMDLSDKTNLDEVKGFFGNSTNVIDTTISSERKTNSLTTDVAEVASKEIMNLKENIGKVGGIEKAKNQLQEIENFISMIKENPGTAKSLVSSLSLKVFDLKDNIQTMKDKGYSNFVKDFPLLSLYIKQALKLRGEKEVVNNITGNTILPDNKKDLGQQTQVTSGEKGITIPSGILPQKNNKLIELLKLKEKKVDNQPLFKTTQGGQNNLIDILLKG